MLRTLINQLRAFPEYFAALQAALVVLAAGLPLYLGLRYFLYRRKLSISIGVTLNFVGVFILFSGLAFLLASPLASHVPEVAIRAYLSVTCVVAAMGVVSFVDVFLLQYYFVQLKKVYISPPLRAVVKIGVFVVAILPILRFVLHFNPLALVAIPTIATAGIAFALQDTLKTFIAGVTLGHIIRLGEWIAFEGREGRVINIDWARTTIETPDGQRVYIPNTLLQTGIFLNYTSGNPSNRQVLKVGATYDVPPAKVKDILVSCTEAATGVVHSPKPYAMLIEYSESAVLYNLFYWIDDYLRRLQIQDDVATRVWYAFKREGIEIPFPIRTVRLERAAESSKREHTRVEEELKHWTLAEAFYNEELEELSRSTRSRMFAPGEIIVRKNDRGQSLFAIVTGQVSVYSDEDLKEAVAKLGPNEIFGEMSLLTGAPRSATVRAETSVEVLEIDKPGMQHIMAKRPELCERLADLVSKRQIMLAETAAKGASHLRAYQKPEPKEALSKRIREFFGFDLNKVE